MFLVFMAEDCIFCKIIAGKIPSEKVYEDDNFVGFLDINPFTKGHTLVIPKKHYKTLLDVPSSLFGEFLDVGKKVALKLIEGEKAEGFNLMMSNFEVAQQEVPHVHLHVVPRRKGDGKFKFLKSEK